MSHFNDLLDTARRLVALTSKDASNSDANRAVSTAYYAAFSCLATFVADSLAGKLDEEGANRRAWVRAYRSIDHKPARDSFLSATRLDEFEGLTDLKAAAIAFQRLQTARESADYDPLDDFSIDEARALIVEAQFVIDQLQQADPQLIGVIVVEIVLRNKQRQSL
jgi:uncharacterized protein (UPF0332 family)